jgi:GxxExxY protein
LLESVYQEAATWELLKRGLQVEREKIIPIVYKGHELGVPLRLDLLVNQKVIIECQATINYSAIFEAQVLTYLRITGLKLGIVINFGEKLVKNGIHRLANGL